MKLSSEDIQHIAKDRNIIVKNVPQEDFDWSRETLAKLRDLKQLREIQCTFQKSCGLLQMLITTCAAGQSQGDETTPFGSSGVVDTPRIQ